MINPAWGEKHICPLCDTQFYDLRRHPPLCPKCGAVGTNEMRQPDTASVMHQMDHESLIKSWTEAVATLANLEQDTSHQQALQLLDAISEEWNRRRQASDYFTWPTTEAVSGLGRVAINSPDRGILSDLGYHVGKNGKVRSVRRQILVQVFSRELPPFHSRSYMDEWCDPGTPGRLRKLAHSIAAFARNAKRRNTANMRRAVTEWESDLRYLHDKIYIRMFAFERFDWPSTVGD